MIEARKCAANLAGVALDEKRRHRRSFLLEQAPRAVTILLQGRIRGHVQQMNPALSAGVAKNGPLWASHATDQFREATFYLFRSGYAGLGGKEHAKGKP